MDFIRIDLPRDKATLLLEIILKEIEHSEDKDARYQEDIQYLYDTLNDEIER